MALPPLDTALWDLHMGAFHYPVLLVADELGLFTEIARFPKGVAAARLGEKLKVGPLFLESSLGTLCALGFLKKKGKVFLLTPAAHTYLLPGSLNYWGGMFVLGRKNSPLHAELSRAAKEEYRDPLFHRHALVDAWATGNIPPEQAKNFTRAMDAHTRAPAQGVAKDSAFRGVKRLLDVGAGSGCVSAVLAAQWPRLQCTLFDFAVVCQEARTYIAQAPASVPPRIHYAPGNFFKDAWPAGHDAILLGNILHDWSLDECEKLLKKAHATLPPGGKLFVLEMLLNPQLTGPLTTLGFSTVMLTRTRGKQFSRPELDALLRKSGFTPRRSETRFGYYSLVVAQRA